MTNLEKIAILEDIMELDENTITEDSILEDIEEWDSLSKLSLMAVAKKQFDKNITISDFKTFVTVKDICDFL